MNVNGVFDNHRIIICLSYALVKTESFKDVRKFSKVLINMKKCVQVLSYLIIFYLNATKGFISFEYSTSSIISGIWNLLPTSSVKVFES